MSRDGATIIPDRVAEELFGPTREAHRPPLSEDLMRKVKKMKTEWQPWARLTLRLIRSHVEKVKDLNARFEIVRTRIEEMQRDGIELPPLPETVQPLVTWKGGRSGGMNVEWVVGRTLQEFAEFEVSGKVVPDSYHTMTAHLWDRVVRKFFEPLGLPQAKRPLRRILATRGMRRPSNSGSK